MTPDGRSKLNSLIAVRFTDQELARLREAAADQGVGASTLARILINQALKPLATRPQRMTGDEFRDLMTSTLARLDKGKVDSFFRDVTVGSPDEPSLLIWAGQTEKWEEFTSLFLRGLLASLGIEIISPEYEAPAPHESPPINQPHIELEPRTVQPE